MPISKEQFKQGKMSYFHGTIEEEILAFLKAHKDQAFTFDEILGFITMPDRPEYPLTIDEYRGRAMIRYLNMALSVNPRYGYLKFNNALDNLIKRNVVHKKTIQCDAPPGYDLQSIQYYIYTG